jgi:thioredoxin reductase (NADPH)
MEKYDVAIIGAGPAGLSAALYLCRANKKVLLLEKSAPGGKLLTLPHLDNYPGVPPTSGMALANSFVESATSSGAKVEYGNVNSVSHDPFGFLVSSDVSSYETRTVIVATGLSFIPSISGEKEFLSKGVSYCATCDGRFFKNKVMAVVGNGDRTLEEAIYLAPLASELHFFCDEQLKGSERYLSALNEMKNVVIHENSKVTKIKGDAKVNGIDYLEDGVSSSLDLSAVFPLSGAKSAASFLSPLKIELTHGFIKTDDSLAVPSCSGLFAIGDIIVKKLRQVVTAASDGANVSQSVINYLAGK